MDDVSTCVKLNPFLYLGCSSIYRYMNVAAPRIWRDGLFWQLVSSFECSNINRANVHMKITCYNFQKFIKRGY